jgi:ParB family chromosome partitioning protein
MSARRRGLGRGLGALIKEEPAGLKLLPVDQLRPNRLQPRTTFDEKGLDDLAESIRSQGVVQPLVVTPQPDGAFTIVAGERRWRAAQRAGLAQVPVVVREVAGDRDLLELALVENLQRQDLDAVEEAEAYRALKERFGLSQEEIAGRVGKGRATVANSLRLLKLPGAVLDLLRDGRLTAGQARPLLSLAETDAQLELARRAVEEHLTARQLERLVAAPRAQPKTSAAKGTAAPPQEVHAAAAQEKLTRRLQTKVEIRRRGKGGTVRIHFHSEDELIRLFDLLMQRGDE